MSREEQVPQMSRRDRALANGFDPHPDDLKPPAEHLRIDGDPLTVFAAEVAAVRADAVQEPMQPGSPEWQRLITASKVAAILGVSPWESPYSTWQRMKGNIAPNEGNDATRRGQYLEDGVLAWWRDQHDVTVFNEQPAYRLGDWAAATPDAVAKADGSRCLVEAKTAAYDSDWGTPGTDEVPTYYLVQAVWQMHISGIRRCYMPVLTSRLRFAEYVIDYQPEWGAQLETRMREFYDSLASDTPPPLDDTTATFETVRRLHPDIDNDATAEVTREQALELFAAKEALEAAEARDRLARSTVLDHMGRARFAVADGVKVARRQPNRSGVSFVPLTDNAPLLTLGETA